MAMKRFLTLLLFPFLVIACFRANPETIALILAAGTPTEDQELYFEARQQLLEEISALGVKDEDILRIMGSVPRHKFVPSDYLDQAYDDHPLPIGHGQTISQPYIVAWMTELLELQPGEKVLEIGTGSGYQAAVLAELDGVEVYSIEIVRRNLGHIVQDY